MKCKIFVLFLILIFSLNVFAVDSNSFKLSSFGLTAQSSLVSVRDSVSKMVFEKIRHQRVDDLLWIAQQSFNEQVLKEKQGFVSNYSVVFSKVLEAKNVVSLAFKTKDGLVLLEQNLNDVKSKNPDVDFSNASTVYENAKKEFESERYEVSLKLIDEGNAVIISSLTLSSKTSALYRETTKNIVTFFKENWKTILFLLVLLVLLALVFRKQLQIFSLSEKISALELESSLVLKLIAKAQKEYFELGTMPETVYNARLSLFSSKLRVLNREVAVLKEDLAMLKAFGKIKKVKMS